MSDIVAGSTAPEEGAQEADDKFILKFASARVNGTQGQVRGGDVDRSSGTSSLKLLRLRRNGGQQQAELTAGNSSHKQN